MELLYYMLTRHQSNVPCFKKQSTICQHTLCSQRRVPFSKPQSDGGSASNKRGPLCTMRWSCVKVAILPQKLLHPQQHLLPEAQGHLQIGTAHGNFHDIPLEHQYNIVVSIFSSIIPISPQYHKQTGVLRHHSPAVCPQSSRLFEARGSWERPFRVQGDGA